ncbi:uncharacterized protein [Dermacentor andersoni]|uniref:uncharacterized protein n=1 Tax=Dermacentor andersoni TaxID=34620 RepID=UPI0021556FA1|nr:uncharacterized protein LOC126516878 [Dermacentor andersoni]
MDRPPGQPRQIETLVFLDFETTGLPEYMPRRKVNVTELSLVAVPRKLLQVPLRCLHKLTLCVQPQSAVTVEAAQISGLDNWELQWCPSFGEAAQVLEKFLYTLQPPICLVAHNGDKFDFPLLRAELKHASPGIDLTAFFCCDSLPAFREILGDAADLQEVTEVTALGKLGKDFWEAFEAADVMSVNDSDEELLSQPAKRPTEWTPQNKGSASHGVPPLAKKRREETGQCFHQSVVRRLDFPDAAPANGSNAQSTSAINRAFVNGNKAASSKLHKESNGLASYGAAPTVPSTNGSFHSAKSKRKVRFSLGSVYERVVGTKMPSAHEAEADSRALAEICARLGSQFLEYVDAKHHMLQNVAPMWE